MDCSVIIKLKINKKYMDSRIHIEYNEQYNFNRVYCDEGYVMTEWDKQDIINYSSTEEMFCPVSRNLDNFYTITIEEDLRNKEEQEKHREL